MGRDGARSAPRSRGIELDGIGKAYGTTWAVRGVDLALGPGESLALFGPNGAGKTTLLKMLATLVTPTRGSGRVAGFDLRTERDGIRESLALLAHGTYLYEDLTARENLQFAAAMRRRGAPPLEALLERVGLAEAAGERVRVLSSGMKRRLAVAMVMLAEPAILLLDEPFTNLDQAAVALLEGYVAEVLARGGTVVVATHDLARGYAACRRAAVLVNGRLIHEAPARAEGLEVLRAAYVAATGEGAG
ncbi:MAG: heme ABC exporter ATP-binding protein CcmA [candidate division NC10 bacterium]|nr:heme ABC exporter ATP-binding protein CcmA [candidate division NC10 bacterium]